MFQNIAIEIEEKIKEFFEVNKANPQKELQKKSAKKIKRNRPTANRTNSDDSTDDESTPKSRNPTSNKVTNSNSKRRHETSRSLRKRHQF